MKIFPSLVVLAAAVATSAIATGQYGQLSTNEYKRNEEPRDYGKTDLVCDWHGSITQLQRAYPEIDSWCAYHQGKQLKNGETFQQGVVDGADRSITLTITARCDVVLDKAWCQYMFKLPLSQCADRDGWTQGGYVTERCAIFGADPKYDGSSFWG
ncbi:hypothetical protein C8R47DRAFT_1170945 [Mycena vitilis]|nr:hypothetical protein C8R47DRAFT_1170945 [Mycena vitilis]